MAKFIIWGTNFKIGGQVYNLIEGLILSLLRKAKEKEDWGENNRARPFVWGVSCGANE